MNLEAIRTLAETGQAASHALRTMHRTAQKEAEAEEQFFKRLMREIDKRCEADTAIDALMQGAPQAFLEKLNIERPVAEVAPPSVEAATPFTPALDYPDSHPVEPPRESNVVPIAAASAIEAIVSPPIVQEPEESSRPARANGTKAQALGDEILAMFRKVQHGSTASLEMEAIFKATGKSASQVSVALTSLAERGLIRRVKQAERGHVTVLMKDAAA